MKKRILYVTGSRAEYGIMKRLLKSLQVDPDIELSIVATGMHCDPKYGLTYKVIESDGFVIDKLVDIDIRNDCNANVLRSMAICQMEFGDYFQIHKFDAVMLLGDRYEILSVAIAAAMHNLPIIHLHGGEKTLGNYDEFIRHAITKMSRLHLASTDEYRNRIIQMGEHPDSVFNIGALGAENAMLMSLPSKAYLYKKFGAFNKPYFMVVFHPETLSSISASFQTEQLLKSLERFVDKYDFFFIGSNSDTGSDEISLKIADFVKHYSFMFSTSVQPEEYLALLKNSVGLIGNSSSGLIEAPSLKIPTINIGDRQKGRVRGSTVIDCACKVDEIEKSILQSQDENFLLVNVKNSINPYYKQSVHDSALSYVKRYLFCSNYSCKDFYDLPGL